MIMYPQNPCVETLTLKVMILGGGAVRRWLGHSSGAVMNGISVLIKEVPQRASWSLLPCENTMNCQQKESLKTVSPMGLSSW